MKTIFKFKVSPDGDIVLPDGAEILSVQEQHDEMMLWALVNTENPPRPYKLNIIGTGWPITENLGKFLSTVQLGGLVFHVFLVY